MYLIDTNALIILLYGEVADGKLTKQGMDTMLSAEKLYVSIVSLWEIAIKVKINKLQIRSTIAQIEKSCLSQGIEILPLKVSHIEKTLKLPLLSDHKDPFDRLILATSIVEGMPLISTDSRLRRHEYEELNARVIW